MCVISVTAYSVCVCVCVFVDSFIIKTVADPHFIQMVILTLKNI